MNRGRKSDEQQILGPLSSSDFGLGDEKGNGDFHRVQILFEERAPTRHNRQKASQVGFQLKER